jgi:hypothetical protein
MVIVCVKVAPVPLVTAIFWPSNGAAGALKVIAPDSAAVKIVPTVLVPGLTAPVAVVVVA